MQQQVELDSALAVSSKKTLWKNRTFTFVFTGYTLSMFGNSFHSIALNLWVLQATGSAKLMSTIAITHMVMSMLFSSIAGTVADRVDRRKLMWITDIIRSLLILSIAFCIAIPGTPFILIIILTALTSCAGLFQSPAFHASLVDIVGKEKVQQATGVLNVADNVSRISGLAIGGVVVAAFGGSIAISVDAVTFMLSAILVLLSGKFPNSTKKTGIKNSFQEDLVAGFKYIWQNPFAKSVIILSPTLITFFTASLMLIQVMSVKVWKANPIEFGIIESSIPIGYMLGAGIIIFFDNKLHRRGWWIILSMVLLAPIFVGLSFAPSVLYAVPLILLLGILFSFCTLLVNVIIKVEVDPELQGRTFGTLGSLTSIASPVALAISSFFADIYGPPLILLINGVLLFISGLIVLFFLKSIRSYK
ncbi:TPA: MFS transporter [Bacillus cereus]|nr:MFS transporter [Bacillus cereus]